MPRDDSSSHRAWKKLAFLAIAVVVGLAPIFVRFDYMPGWLIEHHPREYRRVYTLDDFYDSVTRNPDFRCPPYYQPLLVNITLLVLYSSIVYATGAALFRRSRKKGAGAPESGSPDSVHPSEPPASS